MVGRQSIGITAAALDSYNQGEKSNPTQYQEMHRSRRRAFDTLCVSLLATGDREVCLDFDKGDKS